MIGLIKMSNETRAEKLDLIKDRRYSLDKFEFHREENKTHKNLI
jgi:hypothetical protein